MSVGSILYTLLISPLRLIFEVVFAYANSVLAHVGVSVVIFSLGMHALLLPIHCRMNVMRVQVRAAQMHCRGQRVLQLVRSILPLLLEILFFVAAYSLLSGLTLLVDTSIGPIRNLAEPDGLIAVLGMKLNLLPLLTMAIYLVCAVFFTNGYSRIDKVARYGMSLLIPALLYSASSGVALCGLVGGSSGWV